MTHRSTLCTALCALVLAATGAAQSKDQLRMPPTDPTKGNFPPLEREFGPFMLLALDAAPKPVQFPGLHGGLLLDPRSLIVVEQGGFGPELAGILAVLGERALHWQMLRTVEKDYFAFSQALEVRGDGIGKQIDDVRTCEDRARRHIADVARDGLAPAWREARLVGTPRALHRPDVAGVAYYEFAVDRGGFVVVSTGEHDLPIAHWNDTGPPITAVLEKQAGARNQTIERFHKLDALSYVAENRAGELVAQVGQLPARLIPDKNQPSGFTLAEWSSWRELQKGYVATYRPLLEGLRMEGADLWHVERNLREGAWGPWNYSWAGTGSDQRLYDQWNVGGCAAGCGPVAWAMLFGWGDHRAAVGDPRWSHRWGIYRQDGGRGADAHAPTTMTTGVQNMIVEIRGQVGTFCSFGSGATVPWTMHRADRYLSGRTGATLTTHFNSLGFHEGRLRNLARDSIYAGVPAIIGTGWLTHYPLAFGYAWRKKTERFLWWDYDVYSRWFYVNQGWGGAGNGWVSAGTWFCGRLFAN